ncbi:trypsin-like serine protease [Pendulispora albinea]|uniref:Trypsin-like serine protease n=1 Tax=Pendulispora albinea TaxID=2741071 RepID=A0ABZ2M0P3_9BACT
MLLRPTALPLLVRYLLLATLATACGSNDVRASAIRAADAGTRTLDHALDAFSPAAGAPDRDRDPAALALDAAGQTLCTAAAIASNLLLTARRCVMVDAVACTEVRAPSTLTAYGGDDPAAHHVLARGREVIVASGAPSCDAELALVVLDRDLADRTPLPVRTEAVEKGERIRTVSFGQRALEGYPDEAPGKLVREHVPVVDVSPTQFHVSEAACQVGGGPALDEGTGEVLGIVTQSGTMCTGPDAHNIYARVDVHRALIDRAIARAKQLRSEERETADGGLPKPKNPKKTRPPTDVGQPCHSAADCATGLCVREDDGGYCSRSCGSGDRCNGGYHCKDVTSIKACIAAP